MMLEKHMAAFNERMKERANEPPDPIAFSFGVTESQKAKINAWAKEQDAIIIEKQKNSSDAFIRQLANDGIAYYGAIGGELSYCFSPTSLGEILIVKHGGTKAELNVTDFDSW